MKSCKRLVNLLVPATIFVAAITNVNAETKLRLATCEDHERIAFMFADGMYSPKYKRRVTTEEAKVLAHLEGDECRLNNPDDVDRTNNVPTMIEGSGENEVLVIPSSSKAYPDSRIPLKEVVKEKKRDAELHGQ